MQIINRSSQITKEKALETRFLINVTLQYIQVYILLCFMSDTQAREKYTDGVVGKYRGLQSRKQFMERGNIYHIRYGIFRIRS